MPFPVLSARIVNLYKVPVFRPINCTLLPPLMEEGNSVFEPSCWLVTRKLSASREPLASCHCSTIVVSSTANGTVASSSSTGP